MVLEIGVPMSLSGRLVLVIAMASVTLVTAPSEAAAPIIRDTVCPGEPLQLKRAGQEYTLVIDRQTLNQSSAVLKLQRPNRKQESYTLRNAGERAIATGGSVLRFRASSDKDNCFEIL